MIKAEKGLVPKVAVITRTKDRGILLERAIKSVHQQSMTDFIHVIINDGGDKIVVDDLVKKYQKIIKDRIKVIHNETSSGMEAASNKAIKSVSSEYIAIHDDDDSWHPDFLKMTTSHLDNIGSMGVITLVDKIDEYIAGDSVQEYARERWMPHLRTLSFYDLSLDNFAVPIAFLYKRSVFDEIGYYDESLPVCGDWDFALRFMRRYDIEYLNEMRPLAFYHHRPKASGVAGNSIFAGADTHEKYRTILANRLLRKDLESGGLGIGYLFNQRRSSRDEGRVLREMVHEVRCRTDDLERIIVERTNYKQKVKRLANKISPTVYGKIKNIAKRGRS